MDKMDKKELIELLTRLDLKQAALARMVGTSFQTVGNWSSGRRNIPGSAAILLRLLDAQPDLLPLAWRVAGLPDGRK